MPPALLLGALGLFHAAPAQAQTTTFVSNLGQSGGANVDTTSAASAQGFTTGSATGGYTLSSIEASGAAANSSERATIRAELWSAATGGGPNSKVADLTVPSTVSAGTVAFAAPANTTLTASTTYYFVVYTVGAFNLELKATLSGNEDSGAQTGWSIANDAYNILADEPGTNSWQVDTGVSIGIRVKGAVVPTAPTGVSVTAGDGQLSLTWTAPSGTVSGYDVHYTSATADNVANDEAQVQTAGTPLPASNWVAVSRSGTTASQSITSLTNSETYRVRVRAKNAAGASNWVFVKGVPVAATAQPPAEPTGLVVTPGDTELLLRWTAMGDATGYDVHYTSAPSSGAGAVANSAAVQTGAPSAGWKAVSRSGAASYQKITSLTNDTEYRVRVRATNSNGNSSWVFDAGTPKTREWFFVPWEYRAVEGDRIDLKILLTVPAPADGVTFTLTPLYGTEVVATSDSLLCDQNSARATAADVGTGLTRTLTVAAGETTGKASLTPVEDTAVDHDECFAIQASTAATGWAAATGDSQYDTAHVLIKERPPGEPTNLTVTSENAKLDLSWTAPAVGVVEGYVVHYTSATVDNVANSATASGNDPSSEWVAVSRTLTDTTASQSITGLSNDTEYRVRVYARNGGGGSDWVFGKGTPKTFKFRNSGYIVPPGTEFEPYIDLSVPAPEGGLEFTLTRLLDTSVPSGLCDGGEGKATAEDIGASPPTTVTVLAGETSRRIDYPSVNNGDDLVGGTATAECFALQASTTASGWTAAAEGEDTAEMIIKASAALLSFGLSAANNQRYAATVSEGEGTVSVPVTVSFLPASSTTFTVEVVTGQNGSTATEYVDTENPNDFQIATKLVTFSPSDTSRTKNLSVVITDDSEVESDETIVLRLAEPDFIATRYVRMTNGQHATLTISDNDVPPPAAPTGLNVREGDGQLSLSWMKPSGTVTGYDVHYTSSMSVADSAAVQTGAASAGWVAVTRTSTDTTASQSITPLTNGTTYRVRVRAKNSSGASGWLSGKGTPGRLGAPMGVVVPLGDGGSERRLGTAVGDGVALLEWRAPSDNGGSTITDYQVHYTSSTTVADDAAVQTGDSPSAADGWVPSKEWEGPVDGDKLLQKLEGLTNGTKYRVRVRAVNADGPGAWLFGTVRPQAPVATPEVEEGDGGEGGGGGGGAPDLTVAPPVVTIAAVEEEVTEGGAARFTVRATPAPAPGTSLRVRVAVSDSGDFAASGQTGPHTVVVDESGSTVFSVSTEDDAVQEEDGAVTATLGTGNGYTPHASENTAAVTIRDNDLPVVTIEVVEESISEGGAARFTLRATPFPRAGAPLNVRVRVSQRGDVAASGQTGTRTVVVDESGAASFSVSTQDDALHEEDGILTAVVEEGSGYTAHASSNSATVRVRDNDPAAAAPTAEQRGWLLRFGRTVSQQVVDALQQRFSSNAQPGLELTLAGESLTSATPLEENHVLLSRLLGFEKVSSQELAQGSSFNFSGDGAGPRLSFWGSGALSSFNGSENTFNLRGDVTTALLEAEWRSERWRAGAALSHSRGSGSFQGDRGAGEISGALTGLFPYGRYALTPRLGIWATAGYGWGSLSHNHDGYGSEYNPVATMAMGALGMEGLLLEGGSDGVTLTTTADVLLLKTSSEAVEGLPSSNGNLSRFRLGLEATRPFTLSNGSSLSPSLELGIRQDRGDAETGFGIDLGASLSWSAPERGVSAVVKGRTLLSHGSEDFQEKGLALSFSWQPTPSERGVSLSLSHAVGGAAEGGTASLLHPTAIEVLDATSSDGERFEARLAYGFPFYNDRLTITPSVAAALSPSSRSYSLLWSLAPYAERLQLHGEEPWELSLQGERQENLSSSSTVDHSLKLLFSLPL